ncbi:hypothetical protein LTR35_008537 [Friedmanniomyces endolithicus]|nr:hypothetical protein LTR35_008537 [Friedmanniomyces endolithicus]KAK0825057.1 hypothetical protein LTR73_007344 [Friedmanniomyces endolithicus]KAK1002295.1 hypothetical protein LTR54_008307 [Friedmanniomyces endolithicus]
MTARRAPSICFACQARQELVGRRRPSIMVPKRRKLEISAKAPRKRAGGIALASSPILSKSTSAEEAEHKRIAIVVANTLPAWALDDQPADIREAFRSLEDLWKTKHLRIPILKGLSNPWPEERHARSHNEKRPSPTQLQFPASSEAPISHLTFRQNLALARTSKLTRQVLRAQLLRCQRPTDVLRVVATALTMSRETRFSISAQHEPIVRALYRCRVLVDDAEVLSAVNAILSRYKVYDLHVADQLIAFGLKLAARVRTLKGMKKYLRIIRERGAGMNTNIFRATIAKFSIGHRGLGEIRNGRWLRADLLQVLMGFDDCTHLPLEKQFHLGTFLDRRDWQYLHGWIAALARCKHADEIWREWMIWKDSAARRWPKRLASINPSVTTKTRGDYWFLEQMTYSSGLKWAWKLVEETQPDVGKLRDRIVLTLLEGVEHCPRSVWQTQGETIRRLLLRKYDIELAKIERALSVAWVSTDLEDEAEGYHVLLEEQETVVMERLSHEDFKLEEDFGYPYESVVPSKERNLHDAAEVDENANE